MEEATEQLVKTLGHRIPILACHQHYPGNDLIGSRGRVTQAAPLFAGDQTRDKAANKVTVPSVL